MIPQPVKAVILLFPISDASEARRLEGDESIKKAGQHPLDPQLVFITQTIGNACGTMAVLHAIINSNVTIAPGSPLEIFAGKCREMTPQDRSKLLEETDIFASIHNDAAVKGQTDAPAADAKVDLHYTCFVQSPDPSEKSRMRLIELDGRRPAPLDCGSSEDFLQDVANNVKERYISLTDGHEFSMVALAPSPI